MSMADSNTPSKSLADLKEIIEKQYGVMEKLTKLESQIYAYEGSYLEDTHLSGNIITGWKNFLEPANESNRKTVNGHHNKIFNEADRIFSNSSVTSMTAVRQVLEEENSKAQKNSESKTPLSNSDIKNATDIGNLRDGQNIHRNVSASAKRTAKKKKYSLKKKNQQTE